MTTTKTAPKIRVDMQTMSLEQMADVTDAWAEYPKNKGLPFMEALHASDFRAIAHVVAAATGMTVDEALQLPVTAFELVGTGNARPEGRSGGSTVKPSPSPANGL